MRRVLVVDDEPHIRTVLRGYLQADGFEVAEAADGAAALAAMRDQPADLVLLDVMMPGIDGLEVLRQLRTFSDVYVILVTARAEELDKLLGLGVGADDYVTKPFSPRELKARIKSVLRRKAPEAAQEVLVAGPVTLDPIAHRVTIGGTEIALGPTEFRLLRFFMARPERVHSRTQLLDLVWGDHVYIEERTIDVHVRRLRVALEPFGADRMIETVRGSGYRLVPAAVRPASERDAS